MARVSPSIILLLAPLCLAVACADFDLQSREGRRLLKAGEFDSALERFGRASISRPKDPRVLASLGMILSLKAVSQPQAVRSLEQSLAIRASNTVRFELLLLYMHLGMHADAARLLGPDRIPRDQFFTPEIVTLRAGSLCLADPGRRTLATLERNAAGEVGLYFLARCRALAGEVAAAEETLKSMKKDALRCRLIADLPALFDKVPDQAGQSSEGTKTAVAPSVKAPSPATPAVPGAKTEKPAPSLLKGCRSRFPGTVHLFREPAKLPPPGQPVPPARKLFPEEYELPPYPEDHWRYQSGG